MALASLCWACALTGDSGVCAHRVKSEYAIVTYRDSAPFESAPDPSLTSRANGNLPKVDLSIAQLA